MLISLILKNSFSFSTYQAKQYMIPLAIIYSFHSCFLNLIRNSPIPHQIHFLVCIKSSTLFGMKNEKSLFDKNNYLFTEKENIQIFEQNSHVN